MSYTVTLTGNSSVLQANFLPPIELGEGNYTVGLLSFDSYYTIPNIEKNVNDMFYFGSLSIRIPEGSYDIEALTFFLREQIGHEDPTAMLQIRGNTSTLKTEILASKVVYFNFPEKPHSIGPLLGFTKPKYIVTPSERYTESDAIANIQNVNIISVQCNISSGSYVNGQPDHSLYAFFPNVEPGYKIISTPNPIIYFPINVRVVDNITVRIVDQEGSLINFRGETITIRLHLKKDGN